MGEEVPELLNTIANSLSLNEVWNAARSLMRNKMRGSAADNPLLLEGLRRLGEWTARDNEVNRLIAIDLLVRIPASIKKVARTAKPIREEALRSAIPPLSVIFEKKELPEGAEPAEVRENVAKALADASGDWVLPYSFRAFIAQRTTNIDEWFDRILAENSIQNLSERLGIEVGAVRLRDIALAFAETIRVRRYRLQLTTRVGRFLSNLVRTLVPLRPRDTLPKRGTDAACAVVGLLDELLAVRLTLMDEPEFYEVLEPLRRWWGQKKYPAKLEEALTPIVDKVLAGIVFRARGGQRSESLMLRLRQAINDDSETNHKLAALAKTEAGLSPDVQDWLLRIGRKASSTGSEGSRLLTAVAEERFIRALAPAFLLAATTGAVQNDKDVARLTEIVKNIGTQFGLEIVGKAGDVVEFSPAAHEHIEGGTPNEHRVTLVQPPVLRRRVDGGNDIIMRGLVRSM